MKTFKWTPLGYYYQHPREFEEVVITDGDVIYYEVCWLNACSKLPCIAGWYKLDGTEPLQIKPTHWIKLETPN